MALSSMLYLRMSSSRGRAVWLGIAEEGPGWVTAGRGGPSMIGLVCHIVVARNINVAGQARGQER